MRTETRILIDMQFFPFDTWRVCILRLKETKVLLFNFDLFVWQISLAKMSRVYVGNLDPRVSERDLEDEFRRFGVIRRLSSDEISSLITSEGVSYEVKCVL